MSDNIICPKRPDLAAQGIPADLCEGTRCNMPTCKYHHHHYKGPDCTRNEKSQLCDPRTPCKIHGCDKLTCCCPDRFNREA